MDVAAFIIYRLNMFEAENMPVKISLITTGGTIDKSYDEFEGTLNNRQSQLKEKICSRLRLPYSQLQIISVINKDSLNFTHGDRAYLLKVIQGQIELGQHIVISHGTDTMAKTAQFLQDNIGELSVPVVLTGAMRPMGLEGSDAWQNIAEALLATKLLPPGVYISFHNRVFQAPHVQKNRVLGTFEYKRSY